MGEKRRVSSLKKKKRTLTLTAFQAMFDELWDILQVAQFVINNQTTDLACMYDFFKKKENHQLDFCQFLLKCYRIIKT